MLFVNKLLSQDSLFIIEIQEDAQVLRHLVVLLCLDDALDLALLGDLLFNLVHLDNVILKRLLEELFLLLPIDLSLKMPLLPQLFF
mgnify:FL=1